MHIVESSSFVQAFNVLPMLRTLNAFYSDFEHWYINTVVPGIVLGDDKLVLAMDGTKIAGVALGKKADETKLRCVRVLPEYQQTGIGIKLIDYMIDVLECEKPHCTVAEELLHVYSRAFVNRYGFELRSVDKGMYRPGKLEYMFN